MKNNYDLTPPVLPLQRSADGGHTWLGDPSLIDPAALAADPRDPLHLIASAYRFETVSRVHYRVLESHDGGSSWSGVVDPELEIPLFDSLAIDPFDARTFYGGTAATGFYRSADGGRTWQRSNAGLPLSTVCNELFCEPNDVTTLLADPQVPGRLSIRFRAQVYGSDDNGAHWTFRGPPIPSSASVSFLTRGPGETLLAITGVSRPADAGRLGLLYGSTNGGRSWSLAGRLPSPGNASTVDLTAFLASGGSLFVGTDRLGVLWSRDGGRSWSTLSAGLLVPAVTALAADPADPKRLYAVLSLNGVYTIEVP